MSQQVLDPVERAELYLSDHRSYCRDVLRIRTKLGEIRALDFNPAQEIVHQKVSAQRRETGHVRAIILKARQEGVSTYVASKNFRGIHLRPNRRAVVIADKKDRGTDLFDMYARFYHAMPDDLRPESKSDARGKHLIFDTKAGTGLGTELKVETAGDLFAGRATTIHYLHCSEFAFWPNAGIVWMSLAQAVPDEDTEIYVESTANGVGGPFWDMWQDAMAGENEFLPIFLPWFIHTEYQTEITDIEREQILLSSDPVERHAMDVGYEYEGETVKLSPEQLMWRRLTIRNKLNGDPRLFRQEYPSTPEEAFLVSGSGYFDEEALTGLAKKMRPPLFRGNLVSVGGGIAFRPAEQGWLSIWKWPQSIGRYVIGGDPAEGRMVTTVERGTFEDPTERGGSDFSQGYVFELDTRQVVASLHGRMAPEVFGDQLDMLGYFYASAGSPSQQGARNPAYLGVERNGPGGTVLRVLQTEKRYPNLYYYRVINRRTDEITTILGWVTNRETRRPMLDELAAAIRNGTFTFWDEGLLGEMLTFVLDDDGEPRAQAGTHDDRVLAMAITLQMVRYAPGPVEDMPLPAAIPDTPTGAFDYGWNAMVPVTEDADDEEDPW